MRQHQGIIALSHSQTNCVGTILCEWGLFLMADYNVPLYWTELIYGTLLSPSPLWISDGDVKESVWILCNSGWCFAWMSFGSAVLTPDLYWFVNEKDGSSLAGCIFPWLQFTLSAMMLQQQLKSWAQDLFFFITAQNLLTRRWITGDQRPECQSGGLR